ncbi:uncharacterized protein [Zea mays]|uniref:Uncharacterized protein n=1 Tax=Zea mays TaxID=4577 RepID=B6T8R1_MAIZE|nr:uncharacterized protein LOC100276326 [Zea mays]XP_020397586.1 uncharacterized protein LOC100276326 isoform X1 [Zea mays]ACG33494.1 hypothetical protein [Zea mays]|eukprot:NP_001143612.1 uncharacterized protein LOC100276326 [Zea mays]
MMPCSSPWTMPCPSTWNLAAGTGPIPTEKKATSLHTVRMATPTPAPRDTDPRACRKRAADSAARQPVLPTMLTYSSGFRPTRSISTMASAMNDVLKNPTATMAARSWRSVAIPVSRDILEPGSWNRTDP